MDRLAIEQLIATFVVMGWNFRLEWQEDHCWVHIEKSDPPLDNRNEGQYLDSYDDKVYISHMNRDQIIEEVFVTLQFLTDHELREQFTVDGERIFECHNPPLTGMQHDWFVERKSALRGY
jgi:hypothetical protein